MNKCTTLMDRLEAKDSIAWTQRIGIGTGLRTYTDKQTGRPLIDRWVDDAAPDDSDRPPRVYPTADELRARGLKVFGPKQAV